MLDHIHIENFRLFKNLDIPKVGQVNLITGKNNSGKTTLLEMLRIWANRFSSVGINTAIDLMLINRGEANGNIEEAYKTIFYRYEEGIPSLFNKELSIAYLRDPDFGQFLLSTRVNTQNQTNVHRRMNSGPKIIANPSNDNSFYVPAGFELINSHLWKKIKLTDKEDKVCEVLHVIEPGIERIDIDESDGSAMVRLKNSPKPLPLKNFGEGMNRLLTVALGLVSAENDMLLIDEIDLGLHHSVQRLLWEIVFQKSKDLNVQVFATTHSSDCVQAFSDVANKPEYAGLGNYIRLQRSKKDGDIVAVDYEMEELESAMDLNLETR